MSKVLKQYWFWKGACSKCETLFIDVRTLKDVICKTITFTRDNMVLGMITSRESLSVSKGSWRITHKTIYV